MSCKFLLFSANICMVATGACLSCYIFGFLCRIRVFLVLRPDSRDENVSMPVMYCFTVSFVGAGAISSCISTVADCGTCTLLPHIASAFAKKSWQCVQLQCLHISMHVLLLHRSLKTRHMLL
jgi:hypothetical protein